MTLWSVRTLIVAAERWVDVRDWARVKYGKDPEIIPLNRPYSADMYPDIELVWVGSDAGARPNKRLEVRYRALATELKDIDRSLRALKNRRKPK
jgi:hypothetical protein